MRFAAEIWLFLLLGIPVLALVFRWGDRRARDRLRLLFGELAPQHLEQIHPRLRGWRRSLLLLGLTFLLLALARPQWGAHDVVVKQRGTDVVIALDISNSMLAEDVLPSRLELAKSVLAGFLDDMPRGRVGLVLFAGAAFVQCPLTMDYGTAQIFLRMAGPDMISEQGTAIASALATARDLLDASGQRRDHTGFQAIILVTDGEDLEGQWEQELENCRDEGIVVLPIAVGKETGGLIPTTDSEGRSTGFMKDDQGNVVMTRLDLASLERMAARTGGMPFHLESQLLSSDRLGRALKQLGDRELEERRISAYEERFVWPLLLAFICLLLRIVIRPRRRTSPVRDRAALVGMGLVWLWLLVPLSDVAQAGLAIRPAGAQETARGRELFLRGQYEQALQAFQTARALNPDDARLSLAIGETLHKLQRYDDASEEFHRSLVQAESDQLKAESLYNAGTSRLAAGDPEGAAEFLKQSVRLQPDQQDAWHNLELALRQKQQSEGQQSPDQSEDRQSDSRQQPESQTNQDRSGQQQEQQPQQQQEQQQQQNQENQENQENQQEQQSAEPDSTGRQSDESQQPEPQQQQPDSLSQDQSPPDPQAAANDSLSRAEPADEEAAADMTRARALNLLRALDRDEEQFKQSVQKRLRGAGAKSGKRW